MFRWLEHTGEAKLAIEAESEEQVFADALAALRDLIGDGGGERVSRDVSATGADRAALLADWLSELAFLAETEGFVADRILRLELGEESLRAAVAGELGSPPHLVKAVTYNDLTFEGAEGAFRATVVLDV
jgi:SHS2 domain-containing protein